MMKIRHGFTLAEVLTTLMVIGVVAAMTIPTLMNSTNDQQYKVAFKKAMSILSQGTQLMIAKEEQCAVTDNASLAKCFKDNVITGDLVDEAGKNDGTSLNVIKTADGIAYAFYYTGETGKTATRSLEEICGTINTIDSAATDTTGADKYNGTLAKCIVMIDVNGLNKGSKGFTTDGSNDVSKAHSGTLKGTTNTETGKTTTTMPTDSTVGSDQAVVMLTGDGIRPTFVTDKDKALSRGYVWMYGESSPLKTTTTSSGSGS